MGFIPGKASVLIAFMRGAIGLTLGAAHTPFANVKTSFSYTFLRLVERLGLDVKYAYRKFPAAICAIAAELS